MQTSLSSALALFDYNIFRTSNLHLVDILGSLDDKVENNEWIMAKLSELGQQLFAQKAVIAKETISLDSIIKFVKGRKPSDNGTNKLPYVSMDGISNGKYNLEFSDGMILCSDFDILMVMDGASSGTVFSGQNGIVSSTFARIDCEQKHQELVYWFLLSQQEFIGLQNTGSAIPHANKDFVNSLEFPIIDADSLSIKLRSIREKVYKLRNENTFIKQLKETYLRKFFD